jgi:hypothetical protein
MRPDVYAGRVWATAMITGVILMIYYCFHDGNFDVNFVAPTNGWQSHDPAGGLYLDTWKAIVSDALQVGFGLWGGVLVCLGLYRLAREFKFAPACFSLGAAFIGMAVLLPSLMQPLIGFLVERYPFLVK